MNIWLSEILVHKLINKGERRGLQGTSKSVTSTIGDDDVIQAVELLEVEAI
jgi:hypothetical protein